MGKNWVMLVVTQVRTPLPVCLLPFLPICLSVYLHVCQPRCFSTFLPACLIAYLSACLPTLMLPCLLAFLPTSVAACLSSLLSASPPASLHHTSPQPFPHLSVLYFSLTFFHICLHLHHPLLPASTHTPLQPVISEFCFSLFPSYIYISLHVHLSWCCSS